MANHLFIRKAPEEQTPALTDWNLRRCKKLPLAENFESADPGFQALTVAGIGSGVSSWGFQVVTRGKRISTISPPSGRLVAITFPP